MASEERKTPPLSFVAQKLRDDRRLAKHRDGRILLFSATGRLVFLMLASFVNRKSFQAWPGQETLAAACGLDVRSLRRYRHAIEVFFFVEASVGRVTTYTLKSPEEYEADVFEVDP